MAALVESLPTFVLGGAGLVMFGMVAATGIRILSTVDYKNNRHNLYVVALAIGWSMGTVVSALGVDPQDLTGHGLQAAPGQWPGPSPGTNSPPDCLSPGSALSDERVQLNAAGQVELKLKTPWRDGTTRLVMSPLEFMQRGLPRWSRGRGCT